MDRYPDSVLSRYRGELDNQAPLSLNRVAERGAAAEEESLHTPVTKAGMPTTRGEGDDQMASARNTTQLNNVAKSVEDLKGSIMGANQEHLDLLNRAAAAQEESAKAAKQLSYIKATPTAHKKYGFTPTPKSSSSPR